MPYKGQPFEVAVFHGCYDGDTCTVSLPQGIPALFGDHITVRLAGIDTPEMKGICEEEKALQEGEGSEGGDLPPFHAYQIAQLTTWPHIDTACLCIPFCTTHN